MKPSRSDIDMRVAFERGYEILAVLAGRGMSVHAIIRSCTWGELDGTVADQQPRLAGQGRGRVPPLARGAAVGRHADAHHRLHDVRGHALARRLLEHGVPVLHRDPAHLPGAL